MRRTVPETKAEDAMPTSQPSTTLIKGANVTNKASVAHVLQTMVAVMVDNTVPTRKWSSLEVTSMIISVPT
jgi:hypothetical protein